MGYLVSALSYAESQSYIRGLVDEGEPMQALLKAALKLRISAEFTASVLACFGDQKQVPAPQGAGLLEPLSDRELDVLRLLGSDLSGPEIASQLFVSLNTMRTHTKNIYTKLGVNSRRAAVTRAEELALLKK